MQGDVDHVVRLTTDAISRIHFRGGSHIGISRANPTTDPAISRERRHLAAAAERDATHHDRRRRHGVLGDEARAEGGGPHPCRPRAEDDRQRSRPAALRRHVRVPDRAPLRRRDREEPDGGREDHVALVLRHRDGPEGRPPGAGHRQGGGRDDDADHRGVSKAADPPEGNRRLAGGRHRQATELRPARRRRDHRRGRGARRGPGGPRRGCTKWSATRTVTSASRK